MIPERTRLNNYSNEISKMVKGTIPFLSIVSVENALWLCFLQNVKYEPWGTFDKEPFPSFTFKKKW